MWLVLLGGSTRDWRRCKTKEAAEAQADEWREIYQYYQVDIKIIQEPNDGN